MRVPRLDVSANRRRRPRASARHHWQTPPGSRA